MLPESKWAHGPWSYLGIEEKDPVFPMRPLRDVFMVLTVSLILANEMPRVQNKRGTHSHDAENVCLLSPSLVTTEITKQKDIV